MVDIGLLGWLFIASHVILLVVCSRRMSRLRQAAESSFAKEDALVNLLLVYPYMAIGMMVVFEQFFRRIGPLPPTDYLDLPPTNYVAFYLTLLGSVAFCEWFRRYVWPHRTPLWQSRK